MMSKMSLSKWEFRLGFLLTSHAQLNTSLCLAKEIVVSNKRVSRLTTLTKNIGEQARL